jgi:hypothetical protein
MHTPFLPRRQPVRSGWRRGYFFVKNLYEQTLHSLTIIRYNVYNDFMAII